MVTGFQPLLTRVEVWCRYPKPTCTRSIIACYLDLVSLAWSPLLCILSLISYSLISHTTLLPPSFWPFFLKPCLFKACLCIISALSLHYLCYLCTLQILLLETTFAFLQCHAISTNPIQFFSQSHPLIPELEPSRAMKPGTISKTNSNLHSGQWLATEVEAQQASSNDYFSR